MKFLQILHAQLSGVHCLILCLKIFRLSEFFISFRNNNLFQKQVARIKKVMSWNGYPRYIRNKIIKRLKNQKNAKNNYTPEQENIATIFCRIPYAGVQEETLIKNLVRKLKRHIDKPFKLRNLYRTKKLSYYCNTKNKVPEYLKSHIVYEFCCPACNIKYIGKTD